LQQKSDRCHGLKAGLDAIQLSGAPWHGARRIALPEGFVEGVTNLVIVVAISPRCGLGLLTGR
jgi:hypothetical protein